jgi:putative transferase (TIGR04331 family)
MLKKKINIINFSKNKTSNRILSNEKVSLYIGPWCKNKINLITENFDDTLDLYQSTNIKEYNQDIKLLKKNYLILLKLVSHILNIAHNTKYKIRFWEILIGRWLNTWINSVYFRWDYTNKIIKKYKINNLFTYKREPEDFIPLDTGHAHLLHRGNNEWSELTFEQILNYLQKNLKKKLYIKKKIKNNYSINISYPKFTIFKNKSKLFLYKTEINFKTRLKIRMQYNLHSKTFYAEKKFTANKKFNRKKLLNFLPKVNKKSFTSFLILNLINNIPKIFLENFKDLESQYLKSKFPDKVKFIITSYGHYYDELFKYYVSTQINKKEDVKLCILQHGYGNIYSNDDYFCSYHDYKISDMFLSWGKVKKKNKYIPFFYPRKNTYKIYKPKFLDIKKILFLTYSFSNNLISPPNGTLNGEIINKKNLLNLKFLLNHLKEGIKDKIFIKHLQITKYDNFRNYLTQNFNFIKFENNKKSFLQVEKNYNFFIHIFFGTPFFECLTLNRPCIIIYSKNTHYPLDKKFKLFISKFKEANILFEDIELAKNFINENYFCLDRWWYKKKLQTIRREFCKEYCLHVNKNSDIEIFKKIFK